VAEEGKSKETSFVSDDSFSDNSRDELSGEFGGKNRSSERNQCKKPSLVPSGTNGSESMPKAIDSQL
jgi:hypothetical protein